MFLAMLDSLVPASFNLFCCPVHVCPVFVLSCTVYVGVGVRFPQSVSVLVYCPGFLCVVLDFKSGGIAPPYWGPAVHCKHKKNLPDAGHFIVERWLVSRPWWRFFQSALAFFCVFPGISSEIVRCVCVGFKGLLIV